MKFVGKIDGRKVHLKNDPEKKEMIAKAVTGKMVTCQIDESTLVNHKIDDLEWPGTPPKPVFIPPRKKSKGRRPSP